jgi:predicted HicB family RNase H-like nuclease
MALRKEDLGKNDDRTEQKTKRTRITIDINPELRRRIKSAALQEDISISEYLARILEQSVPKEAGTTQRERRPATRKMLEELRQVREEILQDRGGKSFEEDSTELIRQMREERSRYLEEL